MENEFHSLVRIYTPRGQAMKGEIEKFHSCGQSIWVKIWLDGRTIFCISAPGQRIWVEHCPTYGENLALGDLRQGEEWKWDEVKGQSVRRLAVCGFLLVD